MRYYIELDKTGKTTQFDLLTDATGVAAKYWYAGQKDYDFDAIATANGVNPGGAPKDTIKFDGTDAVASFPTPNFSAKMANGMQFAQLVWKASTTVAFAVKNNWAFAWFCDSRINAKTSSAWNFGTTSWFNNVKKACLNSDNVDVCVNEAELKATNEYRARRVGYEKENLLELDWTAAKAI